MDHPLSLGCGSATWLGLIGIKPDVVNSELHARRNGAGGAAGKSIHARRIAHGDGGVEVRLQLLPGALQRLA
jgi:hypothetical protein